MWRGMGFRVSYEKQMSLFFFVCWRWEFLLPTKRTGKQELARRPSCSLNEGRRIIKKSKTARAGSRKRTTLKKKRKKQKIGMGQQSFQFSNDIIKGDYTFFNCDNCLLWKEEAMVKGQHAGKCHPPKRKVKGDCWTANGQNIWITNGKDSGPPLAVLQLFFGWFQQKGMKARAMGGKRRMICLEPKGQNSVHSSIRLFVTWQTVCRRYWKKRTSKLGATTIGAQNCWSSSLCLFYIVNVIPSVDYTQKARRKFFSIRSI